MIQGKKYTAKERKAIKDAYVEGLRKSSGIMGPAMEAAGVRRRSTIHAWRKADPEFDEACRDAEERAIDTAETALYKNVNAGDTQAIKFLLLCKGKERGYAERQQIDVNATVVRPRIVYEDDMEALESEAKQYNPED